VAGRDLLVRLRRRHLFLQGPFAVTTSNETQVKHKEPTDEELQRTYLDGYYSVMNRQGPAAQVAGLRAVLRQWGNTSGKD